MMGPDNCAVDHVGASIPLDQVSQSFEHCFEHAGFDPPSISTEDAVPLAVFIRQVSPLRFRAPSTSCLRNSAGCPGQGGIRVLAQREEADRSPPIHRPSNQSVRPRLPPNGSLESKPDSVVNLCPPTLDAVMGRRFRDCSQKGGCPSE